MDFIGLVVFEAVGVPQLPCGLSALTNNDPTAPPILAAKATNIFHR